MAASTDVSQWDEVLARDERIQPVIERIRTAAGIDGVRQVIDYGGGVGGWSWTLPHATVYDPDETVVAAGEAFARAHGYTTAFTSDRETLETAHAILIVGVQQWFDGAKLHDFLAFASDRLEPGGRLLMTVSTPWMLFEWLVRLMRRYDGVRAQAMWLRRLVRGSLIRRATSSTPFTYCLWPSVVVRAAGEHRLILERDITRDVGKLYLDATGSGAWLPWYAWLVFSRA